MSCPRLLNSDQPTSVVEHTKVENSSMSLRALVQLVWMPGSALIGTLGIQRYLDAPVDIALALMTVVLAVAIYALNRLTDVAEDAANSPERAQDRRTAMALVFGSALFLLLSPFFLVLRSVVYALYGAVLVVGLAYSVRIVPYYSSGFRWLRLKDVLFLKAPVVAGVWFICVMIIPWLQAGGWAVSINGVEFFMLSLAYFVASLANTIYCDMRDEVGDQRSGIVTLPIRYGQKVCHAGLMLVGGLVASLSILLYGMGRLSGSHVIVVSVIDVAYPVTIWWFHARMGPRGRGIVYLVESLDVLFTGAIFWFF